MANALVYKANKKSLDTLCAKILHLKYLIYLFTIQELNQDTALIFNLSYTFSIETNNRVMKKVRLLILKTNSLNCSPS